MLIVLQELHHSDIVKKDPPPFPRSSAILGSLFLFLRGHLSRRKRDLVNVPRSCIRAPNAQRVTSFSRGWKHGSISLHRKTLLRSLPRSDPRPPTLPGQPPLRSLRKPSSQRMALLPTRAPAHPIRHRYLHIRSPGCHGRGCRRSTSQCGM